MILLSRDWKDYGKQLGYAMELKNLKRRTIELLQQKAYLKFYFRISKINRLFEIVEPMILFKMAAKKLRYSFSPPQMAAIASLIAIAAWGFQCH